jgi:hypothetical protein
MAMYLGLAVQPIGQFDEFSTFVRSALTWVGTPSVPKNIRLTVPSNPDYPYVRHSVKGLPHLLRGQKRPSVFLVMVESFNQRFVEARTPEGQEYTPFVNGLIRESLYVERFYGNSVYTAQGQATVLCGVLPLTQGDLMAHRTLPRLRGLPKILRTGCNTLLSGIRDLGFNGTGQFMEAVGSTSLSLDTGEGRRLLSMGMGLWRTTPLCESSDGLMRITLRNLVTIFRPLMTSSNHALNEIPKSERRLYRGPSSAIALCEHPRATDEYLKTFFRELVQRDYLRNSVVIILGDHSFPMEKFSGQIRGFYYEESFRAPSFCGAVRTKDIESNPLLYDRCGSHDPESVGHRDRYHFSAADLGPHLEGRS